MKILNEIVILLVVLMSCCAENYYDILGVKKDAGANEIKKAYKMLALKYHPDKNKNDKAAAEKFMKINAAYEVLKNPEKKQVYDYSGYTGTGVGADDGFKGFKDEAFHFNFRWPDMNFDEPQSFSFHNIHHSHEHERAHRKSHQFHNFDQFFQDDMFFVFDNEDNREPHGFGGGDSFFGTHFGEEMKRNMYESTHHGHQQQQGQGQNRRCRTVTHKINNVVTTYTECF